jgi:hypothetical protein
MLLRSIARATLVSRLYERCAQVDFLFIRCAPRPQASRSGSSSTSMVRPRSRMTSSGRAAHAPSSSSFNPYS